MAGYKETPRQKMIGMMYLVLTALLALNVSKQIVDSFVVVNESMELTNVNFSKKLSNTYSKFEQQYSSNPAKVGPYWEKAVKARKLSRDLEDFVDSIKFSVMMKSVGISYDSAKRLPLNQVKKLDDYNEPTNYFMGSSEDGSKGQGKVLKAHIELYKKQMLDLVDKKSQNSIKLGLETDGKYVDALKQPQNWIQHNFYRTILAATVTILNKIKAEVYNAEFDVVNHLYSAISAEDYKFDAIHAKVIPKSRFVFSGEEYEAEILVAAYETQGKPVVRWLPGIETLTLGQASNARTILGENGRVTLKFAAGGEGLQKYAGFIEMLDPSGEMKQYGFNESYTVAKPVVSVSPVKMNVFYIGVDNPVEISVPGAPERIDPSVSVGTIRQEGKAWIVSNLPSTGAREAVISVKAVFSGESKTMGSYTFRLKTLPDPIIKIAGKSEGSISKNLLQASPIVVAEMPPGFDFDLKYMVTSFMFQTANAGNEGSQDKTQGNRLSADALKSIGNARKGQRIWIEDIYVKGPDGTRKLNLSLNLKLN